MALAARPQPQLQVTVARIAPRVHVAALSGELDLHNADELQRRLYPLADGTTPSRVIVDLGGVSFVDSTALGVLTGLARLLRQTGGALVIATPDPRLHRLLEITGLLSVLQVERNLATAVEKVVGDRSL